MDLMLRIAAITFFAYVYYCVWAELFRRRK